MALSAGAYAQVTTSVKEATKAAAHKVKDKGGDDKSADSKLAQNKSPEASRPRGFFH